MGPEISVLLERYQAVYVEIPKVACTSVKAAFAPLLGLDLEPSAGNPHAVEFPAPPLPTSDGSRLYPGLYAFAFVRNPWDRLVSCYRDKIGGEVEGFTLFSIRSGVADCLAGFDAFSADMTFAQFVAAVASIPDAEADAHFRSQSSFLMNDEGSVGVDFVGRYESLERDFASVAERIGLPSRFELPRLQVASHAVDYVDFYTKKTQSMVAERFGDDIRNFAYQFAG